MSPELIGSQTPRIWTPPVPEFPTLTDTGLQIAELGGVDAFPWQRSVLDVTLQYDPESRRWVRRGVTLVIARQNGKTHVLLLRIIIGLYGVERERLILHTAQDRTVPRNLFESLVSIIEQSPTLRRKVDTIRETNGQERITLKDGSTYRILAPRPAAFRTWSADLLVFDEAREQRDRDLWGAAIPTQRARPNPQWIVASNAGDPDSVVLNDLRDRGRAAAADPGSDIAAGYLEWSADPDRAIDDRDGWREANPSLGYTITEGDIIDELADAAFSEEAFRTEILCQWVDTAGKAAIPLDEWIACSETAPPELDPSVHKHPLMAVDIDPEQTSAMIVAGQWIDDRLVVGVIGSWSDSDGISELDVADAVDQFRREWRVRRIAYDPWTTQTVATRLGGKNVELIPISGVKFVTASAQLADAVRQRVVWHNDDPTLREQIGAAVRRDAGDDGWKLSRSYSSIPISGVMALARLVSLAYAPQRRARVTSLP